MAGAGSNNTAEAIDLARHAEKAGADALLVVAPYYNKPTQEGLYQHFAAVDDAVGIPIILYNIPPRSVVDISNATMARLHGRNRNIKGVKGRDREHRPRLAAAAPDGADFIQLSGEDMTALAYNAAGGHGCISVVSNVAPRLCADMQELSLKGDYAGALRVQDRLVPLHDAIFLEPGLAGAKAG